MLRIEVCEIRGKCPVHKVGDRMVIDGPRIVLEKTNAVCFSEYGPCVCTH